MTRDVDQPLFWRSTPVNISDATNLNLSFDYFEVGSFESTDFFRASYSLNGGDDFVEVLNLTDDFSDPDGTGSSSPSDAGNAFIRSTFSWPIATGSSFVLQFEVDHNSSSEFYGFDNVLLTGDVEPIPLPGGLPLLAGGVAAFALLRKRPAAR